ncbi:MAG: N-acetyltransferase, partial [Deltaproteobacteria bacterium]|nr:N-acetyltransferase [Deltaproteobacteria bacterium]
MARSADIRTERLLITPFGKRHLTRCYVDWLNDPLLMRFSRQRHKRHTIASCRDYWQSFEGTPNYFWAIVAED